jgi:hypothetical protein
MPTMGLDNFKSSKKKPEADKETSNLEESLEILIERNNPMSDAAEDALDLL